MPIFNPCKVIRPLETGGTVLYTLDSVKNEGDSFHIKDINFQATPYENARNLIKLGDDGVLLAFSSEHITAPIEVKKGFTQQVDTGIIASKRIFHVSLPKAQMGSDASHIFPSILHLGSSSFVIGTTSHDITGNTDESFHLLVDIYAYDYEINPWKTILYESLKSYASHNNALCIFKLCTSVELYADFLVRKFLSRQGIPEHIITSINKNTNWENKLKTIREISSDSENCISKGHIDKYKKNAVKKRNDFVHAGVGDINREDVNNAYLYAFEILWRLDQFERTFE